MVDPGISDHCLIYTSRKYRKVSKEKETIFICNYRHFDPIAFARDVANMNWAEIYAVKDVDEAVALFDFNFPQIINKHMPWKRICCRKTQAPWITSEFFSLHNKKEYFCKLLKNCPCNYHLVMKKDSIKACNKNKGFT